MKTLGALPRLHPRYPSPPPLPLLPSQGRRGKGKGGRGKGRKVCVFKINAQIGVYSLLMANLMHPRIYMHKR